MQASLVVDMPAMGERRVRALAPPRTDGYGWYPLALALEYKAFSGGLLVQTGAGETTQISSRAVRLRVSKDLPALVDELELAIAWPVALDGVTPLRWIVKVKPAWRAPGWVYGCIASHEFRTAGTRNRLAMAACG
jgi:hypothetical protein